MVEDDAPPARILVVDDNEAIHDDFRKVLAPAAAGAPRELGELSGALFGKKPDVFSSMNHTLESATQGEQGLERVRQALENGQPYALAFVDIRMPPGMDLYEDLTETAPEYADRFVFITGGAFTDRSREFVAVHAARTLQKPVEHEALERALHRMGLGGG